jgi:hypothetical protein
VANEGGRLRWKIENEGFNTQKNQGYGFEHPYSQDYQAMKCFYILMQISPLLNLLREKGSLMAQKIKQLGGIKYFAKKLLEEFLYLNFPLDLLDKLLKKKIQIRFFYPPLITAPNSDPSPTLRTCSYAISSLLNGLPCPNFYQ